ncbi:MAG: UvrD-helicase domain-containing protein [Fibromonadales bacterium]|nr:UvrD-helicase domain-containing protein [Fibromonadales bacterium]
MQPFEIMKVPLESKKVLIEASAGTGKTYTIGLIVLRLLLKKEPLSIDQIVLITFTEAATAELKKKTAEKIREAYDIWMGKKSPDDEDLITIIKEANGDLVKKANLLDAIARIDEMPVFTIHGFCTRLLNEFAYETGNFEEKEIITNQTDIENRVIADFWRKEIKILSAEEIATLPEKFSPDILKTGINKILNFPNAIIEYKDKNSLAECYFNNVVKRYSKAKEDIKKSGIEPKYNKNGKIDKRQADKNPLFQEYNNCFEEYSEACGKIVAKLQYELANELQAALQNEKEKMKVRSFGDLIGEAFEAVKNNEALFNAVQKKYKAILVDEFQDTDEMQFEIFTKLFKDKPFFMIGDPKQAIYRFRGGDINAYLRAKAEVECKYQYTLKKNFRSQEKLLKALNEVFNVEDPFEIEKKIEYEVVSHGKNLPEFTINGKPEKPLVILKVPYSEKNEAFKSVRIKIVQEIALLLSTGIQAKDIAILTRTNKEAKEYRKTLRNYKEKSIPAIICRNDNVFESDAADYIMRLLTAFAHSQNENRMRAALMETKLESKDIKSFALSFEKWKKEGVMRAISWYFDEMKLWGKMLREKNGERNVTNLRQLMEILNEEEITTGRVPERTLKRFAELIQNNKNNTAEEHEEKLETDDNAVQIMSIHVSKGLQFPIVFVPDIMVPGEMPGKSIYEKDPPVYYDHEKKHIRIEYEISNRKRIKDNAKDKEDKENVQESARSFYVAVTRPISRLYIVNAYDESPNENTLISAGQKICAKFSADDYVHDYIQVVNDFTEIEYNKAENCASQEMAELPLKQPKIPPQKIETTWQKTSFSGIVNKLQHHDYNDESHKEKPLVPKGAKTGNLLHSIFENLDFDADSKTISTKVEDMLKGFKEFTEEGKSLIKKWVEWTFNKGLGNAGKLKEIDSSKRVAELEFFMSSKAEKIYLEKITKIMDIPPTLEGEKELSNKYLDGKIDLIFLGKDEKYYILDWKSNYLSNYLEPTIDKEAMLPHGYHLQYYIYAVALKRWLNKIHGEGYFEKNFGGVYYIFVRGIQEDEKNNDGIYFKPKEKIMSIIDKLDEILTEKENGKP